MADDEGPILLVAIEAHVPDEDAADGGMLSHELAIDAGDVLELDLEQEAPDGWYFVRKGDAAGLVPETYVERLESGGASPGSDGGDSPQVSWRDAAEKASPTLKAPEPSQFEQVVDEVRDVDQADDSVMIMIEDFHPQAGALNEVKVDKDQLVRRLDDPCPPGWTMVVVLSGNSTGMVGLLPEDYLGTPPAREKSAHEIELKKVNDKKDKLELEVRTHRRRSARAVSAPRGASRRCCAHRRARRPRRERSSARALLEERRASATSAAEAAARAAHAPHTRA